MGVKHAAQMSFQIVNAGSKTKRQVLIGGDEGPNFAMRKFIIEPGGSMPTHTNTVEHEQYVLSGSAIIGIGEKQFEVKKDDVVFIPQGVPHWYRTQGDKPFEFLCVIPNQEDKIVVLE